ncbi:hypothetical protein LOAG_03719 [Loa loa]|uniref:Uncharacterized protein n=1 Tax=Loa loa TaxID=7209 RepID=A0A1S0U5Q8_LOALO|nr:hypothetical protein LOAG_03719 [Loa loa]EFO24767.1 hypothetical protein LOAG_03719 [Loa loa]
MNIKYLVEQESISSHRDMEILCPKDKKEDKEMKSQSNILITNIKQDDHISFLLRLHTAHCGKNSLRSKKAYYSLTVTGKKFVRLQTTSIFFTVIDINGSG